MPSKQPCINVCMYSLMQCAHLISSLRYSEFSIVCHNLFSKEFNEFGGLTGYSLVLVLILVPENCGRLKGLADKAMVD